MNAGGAAVEERAIAAAALVELLDAPGADRGAAEIAQQLQVLARDAPFLYMGQAGAMTDSNKLLYMRACCFGMCMQEGRPVGSIDPTGLIESSANRSPAIAGL